MSQYAVERGEITKSCPSNFHQAEVISRGENVELSVILKKIRR